MNKVLVVAVHPDDETLGCGGTLLKHKAQDDEIYWVIITAVSKNYSPHCSDNEVEERFRRNERIAQQYGFKAKFDIGFPTTMLHTIGIHEIIKRMSKIINEVKPNIIYTMFAHDVHSDHRVAFEALYSCTKSFRYPFIEKIYMMETLSETEFALATPARTFLPNVYVDITDFMEKKLEIMRMYPTEVMQEPYPRSLSSIKALARTRGSRAGVMYAEAFQLLYERR